MVVEHELIAEALEVDEPLIVTEIKAGVARSPQLDNRWFVGLTFTGFVDPANMDDEHEGSLVLTVELAEGLMRMLERAIAKARGRGAGQ